MSETIHLSPPHLTGHEVSALEAAVASGWIAPFGPEVDAFEEDIARSIDVPQALATVTGTAAIELAMAAVGVGEGDVVIAPTLTFIASVSPAVRLGAEPWFVDVDPATWVMDPGRLVEALDAAEEEGRRVGAVVAVDLYGQMPDYDRLQTICNERGVRIIEDAAEAMGSTFRGRQAGQFGDVGTLSFNGNKIITTSGGGAVVSTVESIVDRARFLANQAREPVLHYEHRQIGYNHRMSNLLASVGRSQIAVLPERVASRRANFDHYRSRLEDLPGVEFLVEAQAVRSNRWLTTATIDSTKFGAGHREVIQALARRDIEARPVWKPMHLQPVFASARSFGGDAADQIYAKGICLPSGSAMTSEQVERVAQVVRSCAS